jgi:cytochrome d ubiquinol oxidase subunit II
METIWFVLLAAKLTAYAVLDGFDFGVGAVHLFVARTDAERRAVIAAIGPVWDGNEVWLIAAGGSLVFAFPRAYAAAFSGLYLPLMIVLWLLVLRGVAIEVRSKLDDPLWRAGWDGTFAFASAVMAVILGVALGNVVRGVPLDESGWFQEDLFAIGGDRIGAIDGFTAMLGIFALVALAAHGATYLAMKTTGPVNARSRALARSLWGLAIAMAVATTAVAAFAERAFFAPVLARPWIWPLPLAALACGARARSWVAEGREVAAFLASCGFVALLLVATACALFPVLLRSTKGAEYTLDIFHASAGRSLGVGLAVWVPAIALAVGYFVFVFRTFRGKVAEDAGH